MYLLLADRDDDALVTRPSVRRTALLMAAALALMIGTPLYWASSSEASDPLVAATPKKESTSSGGDSGDDGPSGDDPDGTTAPGQTTSTLGRGGTSGGGTSAPGVTTAQGETSEGGQQTTGGCPVAGPKDDDAGAVKDEATTVGHDTSTARGENTSTGEHQTHTTAGETKSATGFAETATVAGEPCPNPVEPPQVSPPPPAQPQAQPQPPAPPAPAAAPPAQQQAVLPARAVSPTARLRAASGCPPSGFRARVSGRGIASVTFSVDGRRVARVTRADANGLWKTRISTRKLSTGKHRLVARVVFTGAAASRISARQAGRPVARTLSVTFVKCARAAQRPTFTG